MLAHSSTKAYQKRRLASHYFPELQPKSAVEKLKSWVFGCPELMAELEKTHFCWRNWDLTPRQVDLIIYYIGDPEIPLFP